MRRSASEVLRSLEQRIARLEKEAKESYPWDDCMKDQMEQYGDEETAAKVCGKIKAQSQGLGKSASYSDPKVGDILCSRWGGLNNRVDFYKVTQIGLRGRLISLQKLEKKIVQGDENAGYVIPSKREDKREKLIKAQIVIPSKEGYYVELNRFTEAHLWDGKKKYFAG